MESIGCHCYVIQQIRQSIVDSVINSSHNAIVKIVLYIFFWLQWCPHSITTMYHQAVSTIICVFQSAQWNIVKEPERNPLSRDNPLSQYSHYSIHIFFFINNNKTFYTGWIGLKEHVI